MALSALVFDVDGTLVDSNPAHLQAWEAALATHGYKVSTDRIAVEIGKGGDKLIPSILGQEIDRSHGEALRKTHGEVFTKLADSTRFALFLGTEKLLEAARRHGLAVWADRIRASGAKHVWAYFNNDREGHAIKNARELLRQLRTPKTMVSTSP